MTSLAIGLLNFGDDALLATLPNIGYGFRLSGKS